MIGIINTNFGNLNAITNIYNEINIDCKSVSSREDLDDIKKLIIPGIGNFDNVIFELKSRNLFDSIDDLVLNKKIPILGICIGMHIFFESSNEGLSNGFGWVKGKVEKFNNMGGKYPHMGWNQVLQTDKNELFLNIDNNSYFYFLHSYKNQITKHSMYTTSSTFYGETFASSIKYKNIYGVQFHPEKSHSRGVQVLSNFANNCA